MQFLKRISKDGFEILDFEMVGGQSKFTKTGIIITVEELSLVKIEMFDYIPDCDPIESPMLELANRLKIDFIFVCDSKRISTGGAFRSFATAAFFDRKLKYL